MNRCGVFSRGAWRRAVLKGGILVLTVALVAAVTPVVGEAVPPTMPTPYHNGGVLVCSDCHTMHASQQHSYTGGSSGSPPNGPPETYPWSQTPADRLLRRANAAELCLACHNGQSGVPDVMQDDANGLGDDRAAGAFAEAVDTDTYKGHNLGSDPPRGGSNLCMRCHFGGTFTTAQVTCIDCHNPHGNGSYRNLQWASSPNDPSQPQIVALTDATGINKYDQDHVGYSAPAPGDNTWREVTNICLDCHHSTVFFPTTVSPHTKHPGTNSEGGEYFPLNRPGANTDPTNWVNGGNGFSIGRLPFLVQGATTFGAARTVAADNEVFCLSCHKAHGSGNGFALRWEYGTGAPGTNQAGCQQCHNK